MGTLLQVELKTRDGEFVARVRIPSFQKMPEALIWGSRIFVIQDGEYREGIAWFVDPRGEFSEPVYAPTEG